MRITTMLAFGLVLTGFLSSYMYVEWHKAAKELSLSKVRVEKLQEDNLDLRKDADIDEGYGLAVGNRSTVFSIGIWA